MKKIFCLIGKSATGKSTIERLLCNMGYKRIISYTTRPRREKEVNGVDYNFISGEEYLQMELKGEFIETAPYRDWKYGISGKGIDLSESDYVAVVTPHGLYCLQKTYGKENVIPIYIYVNDKEKILRALNREVYPDVDEICRRHFADKEMFQVFQDECTYKVQNLNADESARIIDRIIKSESK